jgi:deazaflavin-dependent oxidoreductase (nitroreductase family)
MSMLGRIARRFGYRGWHQFTQTHVRAYRASRGRIGRSYRGAPVLLLDHVGRKSRKRMTSPLIYGEDGDNLVLVASFGGAPRDPFWWPNLKANPETTVNVYGDVRRVRARQATPAEKARIWPKMVEVYAPYEDYQRKTSRDIPVVILESAPGPASP